MNPSSIPPSKIKSKERTFFAILLAVIVHLMIAVIVYFTVFYNKNPSQSVLPHSIKQPVNQTMYLEMTEEVQTADSAIPTNPINSDETPAQTLATQTANPTDPSEATNGKQAATELATGGAAEALSTSSESDNNRPAALNPLTPATISEAERALATTDTANPTAEYKLKKTEEYKRREAEIDEDNEQLSKLINEVKRRNQTQIQQHQTPKPAPRNTEDTPVITPDYPITPIIPSTAVESEAPAENRTPATKIPATND